MSNVPPLLVRRRDAAAALGVSESQVLKFERAGLLHPIKIPDTGDRAALRAIRYAWREVEALAAKWIGEAQS